MFYHHVLAWKACYTSFTAVLCKPTSRTDHIVLKVFRDTVHLGSTSFHVHGDYETLEDESEEYLEPKTIKITYGYL